MFTAWWMRGPREALSTSANVASLSALDADAPAIMAAIVPAMLADALPAEPALHAGAVDETVANAARAIAGLPPAAQKELQQLFALLAFAPSRVTMARVMSPWREASRDEVTAFLQRWRESDWKLQRSAYDALHQIVYAAWYGNPRSWSSIGYGGPPSLAA